MGGRIESKFLNDSYEVVMKLSRNNPSIKNIAAMNEARAKFATVFHNQDIFAFGGRKGGSLLNSCERYNILLNKWEGIKNMP
jgi:Mg2+/Co2+ transporter CorC